MIFMSFFTECLHIFFCTIQARDLLFHKTPKYFNAFYNKVMWTRATPINSWKTQQRRWRCLVELLATVNNSSRKPWIVCFVNSRALAISKGFYPFLTCHVLCGLTGRNHFFDLLSWSKQIWVIKIFMKKRCLSYNNVNKIVKRREFKEGRDNRLVENEGIVLSTVKLCATGC